MKLIMRTCIGREDYAEYMHKNLDGLIEIKDEKKDPVGCFLRALEAAGNEAAIHFEDDCILTQDFLPKAEMVISLHSDKVIQFFSMRKADLEIGSRIENGSSFLAAVCFYTPPNISAEMREFFPTWDKWNEHPTGLDLTIADYLKATKQKYFIQCPNLADHRIGKSEIDSRRSSKRISKTFVDPVLP